MSDVDLIVVARSEQPFVDRFRDYPELLGAPTGVDLLVYTSEEFTRQRRESRFIRLRRNRTALDSLRESGTRTTVWILPQQERRRQRRRTPK